MTPRYFIRREGKWVQVTTEEFLAHQPKTHPERSDRPDTSPRDSAMSSLNNPKPKTGLGDIVHAILKPFVRGTRLENCTGCARRREALNRLTQ